LKTEMRKQTSAFGFLEIIAVLVVTLMLLAGAYRMIISATKSTARNIAKGSSEQQMRHAVDVLVEDIRLSGNNPQLTSGVKASDVKFHYQTTPIPFGLQPVVPDPVVGANYNLIRLYSVRNPNNSAPWSSFEGEVVRYRLAAADSDGIPNDLIRTDEGSSYSGTNSLPTTHQILARNISSVSIAYFQGDNTSICSVTVTSTGGRAVDGTCSADRISLATITLKYLLPDSSDTKVISENVKKWIAYRPTPTPTPAATPGCATYTPPPAGGSSWGCCQLLECSSPTPYVIWMNCGESFVYDVPNNPIDILFDCTACDWGDPTTCNSGGPSVTPLPTPPPTATPNYNSICSNLGCSSSSCSGSKKKWLVSGSPMTCSSCLNSPPPGFVWICP
jgi:hypothetical protein